MDHERQSVPDRLRALGETPIDPETRAAHHRRMDVASPSATAQGGRRRFGPVAVGAAALVGFLAGSTGLAMAGALPDAAQGVAHDVLEVVRVDVPAGKDGKRGPCVAEAAKIADEDEKQAAKDACPQGKPVDSGPNTGPDHDDVPGRSGDAPGRVKHADDPCRGRPPWAGPMSAEERAELQEQHGREGCVDDPDDDESGGADDAPGRVKHADDPCRGRPPWAGPMSAEERAELQEQHGREGCVDDADDSSDAVDD